MKVVLCCLDGENLVGSRKKMSCNKLVNANCLPEGGGVLYHLLFVVVGV